MPMQALIQDLADSARPFSLRSRQNHELMTPINMGIITNSEKIKVVFTLLGEGIRYLLAPIMAIAVRLDTKYPFACGVNIFFMLLIVKG